MKNIKDLLNDLLNDLNINDDDLKSKIKSDLIDFNQKIIDIKKTLSDIVDLKNISDLKSDNLLNFNKFYKIVHACDYLQNTIDNLNDFIKDN